MNRFLGSLTRQRSRPRLARMACVAAATGFALAPLTMAGSAAAADKQIQHVVFLMQENHTFDNYFSSFPGVDQPADNLCVPNWVPTPLPKPTPIKSVEPSPSKAASPTPVSKSKATPTPITPPATART